MNILQGLTGSNGHRWHHRSPQPLWLVEPYSTASFEGKPVGSIRVLFVAYSATSLLPTETHLVINHHDPFNKAFFNFIISSTSRFIIGIHIWGLNHPPYQTHEHIFSKGNDPMTVIWPPSCFSAASSVLGVAAVISSRRFAKASAAAFFRSSTKIGPDVDF